MPELNLNITSDVSPAGLQAELAAIKVAVALIATRLPKDLDPFSIPTSLESTGEPHAVKLAELIKMFLDQAHQEN